MNSEAILIIKATAALYKDCAILAWQAVIKNWPILFGSIALYLVFLIASYALAPAGMAGGMVVGFLSMALLAIYYGWLADARRRTTLRWNELFVFDYSLFSGLISVAFIFWIVSYLIRPLASAEESYPIYLCIRLGMFLIFNAIPEVIYISRIESIPALKESASFTIRNWIEWFFPLIVLLSPALIYQGEFALESMATSYPLLPPHLLFDQVDLILDRYYPGLGLLGTLVTLMIVNWFMFFRGELFRGLENGSRRRRVYEAKNR